MSSTGKSIAGWKAVTASTGDKSIVVAVLKRNVTGCRKVTMVMQSRTDKHLFRGDCLGAFDGKEFKPLGTFTYQVNSGALAKLEA